MITVEVVDVPEVSYETLGTAGMVYGSGGTVGMGGIRYG